MEKDIGNLKIMILMLDSGKMEKLMDMGFIKNKMDKTIKDNSSSSRNMEKVLKYFLMVIDMKVSTCMVRLQEKENIFGQKVLFFKESYKMDS